MKIRFKNFLSAVVVWHQVRVLLAVARVAICFGTSNCIPSAVALVKPMATIIAISVAIPTIMGINTC